MSPPTTVVNPLTVELAIEPVGRPWLCRAHDIAGGAAEPACCPRMVLVQRHAERVDWWTRRLAAKPSHVQLAIGLTTHDPVSARETLKRHAAATQRTWTRLRAAPDDDWQDGETVNLRALLQR